MSIDLQTLALIFACGLVTYACRAGGHVVLSRFPNLDPRVEAALDAVPLALLTALAVPYSLATGPAETIAAIVTCIACLRLPTLAVLGLAVVVVALLRQAGL